MLSLGMKGSLSDRETLTVDGSGMPAAPKPADLAAQFPQLEILELLGRGGMGFVYRARQKSLDRLVALKILSIPRQAQEAFAERFAREARALASLDHPNIVTVHDFGRAGEHYYLVMEYIEGHNLREAMQAERITSVQTLSLVIQVCEALQFAHDAGIVHRDIKPENILIDAHGRVKIADFGLAKILGIAPEDRRLTGSNQTMGTAHYMAPEQIEHPREVDHRADIYSLGVVFYELLTGELPLGRFEPPSRKIAVDMRIDEVVLKALEKEPRRRYQAANEVKTDVEHLSAGPGSLASPVEPAADAVSPGRLQFAGWACIVDAALQLPAAVVFGLVGGAWLSGQREPDLATVWVFLNAVLTGLIVFILTSLRRMLSEHLHYDRASGVIVALIVIHVVWFLGDTASFVSPVLEIPSVFFTIAVWIALGVGHIVLGVLLLGLRKPSPGLIAGVAWTAIATGICLASVILVLLSVPGVIVFDVLLAVLFFKVADRR